MSDETNTDFPSSADRAVDSLHRIDEKVNRLREDRLNDPDSLGDKLIKSAVPALAGLVAGKAFQMIWDKGTSKRNLRKGLAADAPQSLAMSLAFAAVSAALGAVVSQLSDRSISLVKMPLVGKSLRARNITGRYRIRVNP